MGAEEEESFASWLVEYKFVTSASVCMNWMYILKAILTLSHAIGRLEWREMLPVLQVATRSKRKQLTHLKSSLRCSQAAAAEHKPRWTGKTRPSRARLSHRANLSFYSSFLLAWISAFSHLFLQIPTSQHLSFSRLPGWLTFRSSAYLSG